MRRSGKTPSSQGSSRGHEGLTRELPATFCEALKEASCGELISIVLCSSCILFTFCVAFFMPEIATRIQSSHTLEQYAADQRASHNHVRRTVRDSEYSWRNETLRACSQSCVQEGSGSVYLQPLGYSSVDMNGEWKLRSIAMKENCRRSDANKVCAQNRPLMS